MNYAVQQTLGLKKQSSHIYFIIKFNVLNSNLKIKISYPVTFVRNLWYKNIAELTLWCFFGSYWAKEKLDYLSFLWIRRTSSVVFLAKMLFLIAYVSINQIVNADFHHSANQYVYLYTFHWIFSVLMYLLYLIYKNITNWHVHLTFSICLLFYKILLVDHASSASRSQPT